MKDGGMMAKELPYFRFTVAEWLNDDISLESYEVKGLFADVCAWYWFMDCDVDRDKLYRKFSDAKATLEQCFKQRLIKADSDAKKVHIDFLDDQYNLLTERKQKYSKAGRLGGLARSSNAKASLKHRLSYKDKDKDKDKDKYAEYVTMTSDEHQKLVAEHGEVNTRLFISILNNYKGSKGKRYKSDYRAILSWVVDRVKSDGKYVKPKTEVEDDWRERYN